MSMPDMNPLAAKLMGGVDYRRKLKQQLLDQADAADDPAYAERLRAVAEGRRPLRTLLHDPAFLDAHQIRKPVQAAAVEKAIDETPQPRHSPAEYTAQIKDALRRAGIQIPSPEEAKAIFAETERLASKTRAIVNEEELTGWGGTLERLAAKDEAEAVKQQKGEEPPPRARP